ncbi:MAG: GTP cyclohydrolase IIa [Candidatus Altiarchaeota archaeon]|nr:GTP cyclohydrolase IIa [Candidatus Altiarchaeota archaeon]
MLQVTLIQIDNYGPWTTTPLPKKEAYLQGLQAGIYRTLQKKFSMKKALVFPMRYDNLLAITNGMDEKAHRTILDQLKYKFPVSLSMSVATGKTPYEAQANATRRLSREGGAKHAHRKSVLAIDGLSDDPLSIAHADIDSITAHTDSNVYDSYVRVVSTGQSLTNLLAPYGALVFYMGGDNFIIPCGNAGKKEFLEIFKAIEQESGVGLKAGIGSGRNAEAAVGRASMGLKKIRLGAMEKVVEYNED